MSDAAIAAIAERQLGIVSRLQARAAGFTPRQIDRRIESRRWIIVATGVYRIAGSPKTWEQGALAAVLAAGPYASLSHRAGAALWTVPGFKPNRIEVTKPHGVNRRVGRLWIHGSLWLPEHHTTMRGPIRVVTPARMLCDVASQVHEKKLARAVDNCLSLNLVKIDVLVKTFEEWARRGRTGSAAMRAVLEPRGEGYVAPASELEAEFLGFLDEFGLAHPAREVALGDEEEPIGRVEMVYRDKLVLVELDGRRNHTALLDREADALRDMRFTAAGWSILRITWKMLMTQRDYIYRSLVKLLTE